MDTHISGNTSSFACYRINGENGELWIDYQSDLAPEDKTPFRFTGKELDQETGLYYYGYRYLDPKTSRWLSADPAVYSGEYIPGAPINDAAVRRNQNLPGQGGIFNVVNMHVYHYAGNNPVKYTDPDGRDLTDVQKKATSGNAAIINKLHPAIRDTVRNLITTLEQKGISIGITATSVRTIEQQDAEYQKGRDENGKDIPGATQTTWVKGGASYHNYGLAIDLEVYDASGKKDWNFEGSDWQTVITEAEKAGFTAGYRWAPPKKDPPHFENGKGLTTGQLKDRVDAGKVKDGFVELPQ